MGVKKTAEDYRALAESKGFRLLQDTVGTTKDRVLWGCSKNHKWEDTLHHVLERGCPDCRAEAKGRKKPNRNLTAKDFREAGERYGFEWTGERVVKALEITTWKCSLGHEWLARYSSISGGISGCPHCSGKARKTREDYEALAESRGFVFKGTEVPANTGTPTEWWCGQHLWVTTYESIKSGCGCHYCSKKARRTLEDYLELAKLRDITFIDNEIPATTNIKVWWRCSEDHTWKATFQTVASARGNGCEKCWNQNKGERLRLKIDDYYSLADSLGYEFLGVEVKKTKELTYWRCSNGHKIRVTYDSLKQGQRCNQCSQSTGEQEVSRVLRKLGIEFETERRFEGCKNKKTLPFDFYFTLNGKQILIEVDGQLHYMKSRFFSPDKAAQKLKDTQRRDAIKDKFAQENGYHLLRIPYWRFKEIETILTEEINKHREESTVPPPMLARYKQLPLL